MSTTKTIPVLKDISNLQFSQWIYHHFNYLCHKRKQKMSLLICLVALVLGVFNGAISALEEAIMGKYANNFFRYFICSCSIQWNRLVDCYESWVVNTINRYSLSDGLQISFIIDDSLVPKDRRSQKIAKGGKRKLTEGLSLLTTLLSCGEISLPLVPRLCFRREYCERHGRNYESKTAKAGWQLNRLLEMGLQSKNLICLFDSWYAASDLINYCQNHGLKYVFGIKSNRQLNGRAIKKYKHGFRGSKAESVIQGDYDFHLQVQQGKLNHVMEAVNVLISKRVHRKSQESSWRYFCTNLDEEKTIFHWVKERWKIETFHQVFKYRFKPENWRVHGEERMSHLLILTTMSMGFAVRFFLSQNTKDQYGLERLLKQGILSESLKFMRVTLISNRPILQSLFERKT